MTGDWYDYPAWYDILHAAGTAREVTGLERIEARYCTARGRLWLEPACGSGRYLRTAAGRGIRVIGFDRSEGMIDYARTMMKRRSERARFFVADLADFASPARATFAFCPINTIRHLPSDRAMLAHFACVRRALASGGVYALGIETCRYGLEFPSEDIWEGRRGRVHVQQAVQYLPPGRGERIERVISHLTIRTPTVARHLDSRYDLRAYSDAELFRLLAKARWRVLGVCDADGHDALRGPRGRIVGGYGLYVLAPA